MTDNLDPFVNLVIEPGENEFIALKRNLATNDDALQSVILPRKTEFGHNYIPQKKLPFEVQLYVGMLSCAGLFIVYRFLQK
jgi:hypothetical protein